MGVGIGFGQTLLGDGFDFQSKLAERTFVIVGSDAFERSLLGRRHDCSLGWSAGVRRDRVKQRLGRGIAGSQRESVVQLARCARHIAGTVEFYGQIEVIVGIVRIRIDCFLKIVAGGFSVCARADHSQIVVHLGERQPGGNEAECGLRARKIFLVVGCESEIEIRLSRERIIFGDARQRGDAPARTAVRGNRPCPVAGVLRGRPDSGEPPRENAESVPRRSAP